MRQEVEEFIIGFFNLVHAFDVNGRVQLATY